MWEVKWEACWEARPPPLRSVEEGPLEARTRAPLPYDELSMFTVSAIHKGGGSNYATDLTVIVS